MALSISDILEDVRAAVASGTEADVFLGAPAGPDPGLYLFPYRLTENAAASRTSAARDPGYEIHCLFVADPAGDHDLLDDAMRFLRDNPVVASGETRIRAALMSPPADTLTRIFDSAGLELRLAVPFTLVCSPKG